MQYTLVKPLLSCTPILIGSYRMLFRVMGGGIISKEHYGWRTHTVL